MHFKLSDPHLLPKFRGQRATVIQWNERMQKWVVHFQDVPRDSYYSTEDLQLYGSLGESLVIICPLMNHIN